MPTYDYLCKECGYRFEYFQTMSSPALKTISNCKNCKQQDCNVERIISGGSGLIFKGSGFYLTDYKNKKSESKKSNSEKSETKSEKKKNSSKKGEKPA
tara:strand:- start:1834 stop:2127 length:294 start_codon:yes stop_codon:yes gene_type:complete